MLPQDKGAITLLKNGHVALFITETCEFLEAFGEALIGQPRLVVAANSLVPGVEDTLDFLRSFEVSDVRQHV